MNPSPGRYIGKSIAEPIMLKKAFEESPLLQELLPKATLQLSSSLSNDDKEVLIYLIGYGRRVMHAMGAPSSVCKSPWWKSPSKASRREQVFPSWSFSDSCTESSVSIVLAEEVSLKRSSRLLAKHKASSTCDCFSCYSSFWSRWNVSPNRDLMNDILDVIEEGPKSSKGKKKKRADKKRAALGPEACGGKPSRSDGNVHHEMVHMTRSSGLTEEELMDMQISNDTFRSLDLNKASVVMTIAVDSTPHASIMTDEAPKIVTQTLRTGRKKSMFRVTKQKEEACVSKSPDLRVNKVSGVTGIDDDESLSVSGLVGDRANGMEAAVAIEVSGNFTTEASEVMAVGIPALLLGKNTPRLHRIGKRRHNQVIPLDCEGLLDVEKEQEASITVESTQAPMSPRAADIGLGGRGFLARVFPDALGRVASRLWDLVSVRLRSRTVEYH